MATLFSQNALNRLHRRRSRFVTHAVRVVLLLQTVIGILTSQVTEAAPLQLRVLVRTNDVATGSGADLMLPDGRFSFAPPNVGFNFQFGPPVAASGGYFAFPAYVSHRDAGGVFRGSDTGIWGGRDRALVTLERQRSPAPGLGTNTHPGLMNVGELGKVGFYGNATLGDGLWSGDASGSSPVELVRKTVFGATQRPVQSANYLAFSAPGTNWLYDTDTKELRAVSYRDYPALAYGPSVTLSNQGNIVALTTDGRLLLQGDTSDGTNRLFLINKLGVIIPVMSQGDPAPGIPNRRIGLMTTSGNDQGYVAVAVGRLDDGDANPFNDRSALFAGPATNVFLVRHYPTLVGGGVFISRSNYLYGFDHITSASGIFKVPASTNESLTFTPLPPFPYPPRTGDGTFASVNALGQYAVLYASSTHPNQKNSGLDLWFFNPGDGWTNVARGSSNLVVGGETILVNAIGFMGSFSFPSFAPTGGGYASGLTDDGTLTFTINGTHIITTGAEAAHDFYWTGLLGPNWHTTNASTPFTSWESVEKTPRKQPPGDAEPNTASVFINAFPGETVVLNQKPTPVGSLNMSNGLLRLQEHLTLNRFSKLHDVRMESPNGSLTANADVLITNTFEWITGTVDGSGQLSASDLLLTNGTTTRLNTALTVVSNAMFDGGGRLIISNAVLRTRGKFVAGTGTITNTGGASPVQNFELWRKDGPGNFTIYPPFHAFEALLRTPRWGIDVDEGRLSLLGGGQFFGYQTNTVALGTELELAGRFECRGEMVVFRGLGKVKLGAAGRSIDLDPFGREIRFETEGHSVHLTNGMIRGNGRITNSGAFYWEGGRIAGDANTTFQNGGDLFIEDATLALTVDGTLINYGQVIQRGDLFVARPADFLDYYVQNRAGWLITAAGVMVSGVPGGRFLNGAGDLKSSYADSPRQGLYIVPGLGGTVEFSTEFLNSGLVDVNAVLAPNVTLVLHNLASVADNVLLGGDWRIHTGGTISTPNTQIEAVEFAQVEFRGGQWTQFHPTRIDYKARVRYASGRYDLPGPLEIGNIFHAGALEVQPGGSLTVNGNTTVGRQGEVAVTGNSTFAAELLVSGILDVDGKLNIESGGRVEAGTLQGQPSGRLVVNGQLLAPTIKLGGARCTGGGTINGQLIADGALGPGTSPGLLRINGNVVQTNSSVLVIEIAGTVTNQFDRLIVSGNASLDGTLAVNLLNGFQPAAGDSFPIVQAGAIMGRFANATNGQRIATIDGYGSVVVNYTPTGVVLSMFQLNPAPPPTARAMIRFPELGLGDALNLALTGSPGRDYILQTTTNLSTNALDWISIRTNNAGFDGRLEFDLPSGRDPHRFFRALNR